MKETTTISAPPRVPEVDAEGRCIWCGGTPGTPTCAGPADIERNLALAELARVPEYTFGGQR